MGSGTQEKCNLQSKDCIFSCATHGGNGDHVEGTSCGSKSKDDDVCLHWETHWVRAGRATNKHEILKTFGDETFKETHGSLS